MKLLNNKNSIEIGEQIKPENTNIESKLLQTADKSISNFDDILETIDANGLFQKKFSWIFNFVYAIMLALTSNNNIMALATPDHWCYVPGRNLTNYTIDKWRELTIPLELNANGATSYSKCEMYSKPLNSQGENRTIGCQYGWEYNNTWYESTIPSSEDWVCDKEIYATHAFMASRIGEFIGLLIFGPLGDILGRRPIFYITVLGMTACGLAMLVATNNYYVFMFVTASGSLTVNAGFQSTLSIAMEISSNELRATINSIQYLGWTLGTCLLPISMWIIRRWDLYIWITTLPGMAIFFFYNLLIESPRWLLSRGEIKKCLKQLKIIAKYNKKKLPENISATLKTISVAEKTYGLWGLFSSVRLIKNCALLCISWCTVIMCYNIILYHIENLGGNPFLNFLLLAMIEFPSSICARIMTDRLGRRLAQLISFFTCAVSCLGVTIILSCQDSFIAMVGLTIVIKFFCSLSTNAVNLQTLEIFPTCIRQTGLSVCFFISVAVSTAGPYVSYLGKYNVKYPYIIIGLMTFVTAITGTFLPETANITLPETLEEARTFGADQLYWNFTNKTKTKCYQKRTSEEDEL